MNDRSSSTNSSSNFRTLRISTIVLTKNRPREFEIFLRSFRQSIDDLSSSTSRFADLKIHLHIGLNGAGDGSVASSHALVTSVGLQAITHFHSLDNLRPGHARNEILRRDDTSPDWWLFFDDDIVVPREFFIHFDRLLDKHLDAQVFGGPNLNPDSRLFTQTKAEDAQGIVLACPLITGPMSRRYRLSLQETRTGESELDLTLCNLFLKSRPSPDVFPKGMICGEELAALKKYRPPYVVSNLLAAQHFRRSTLSSFGRQAMKYGIGRAQLTPMLSWFGWSFLGISLVLALSFPQVILPIAVVALSIYLIFTVAVVLHLNQQVSNLGFRSIWLAGVTCQVAYLIGILCGTVPWFRTRISM